MKLLVLLPRFPLPLDKGDRLRAYHQVVRLAERHEVVLFALSHEPVAAPDRRHLEGRGIRVESVLLSAAEAAAGVARALATDLPLQVGYFLAARAQRRLEALAAEVAPDRVFCQSLRTAEYARRMGTRDVTLDLMDAFSWGMEQRAHYRPGPMRPLWRLEARRLRRYEAALVREFPRCTIISPLDRDRIDDPCRDRIHLVGNGVDLDAFHPADGAKDIDVLFAGNMAYPPNVWAAERLVTEILPLVRRSHPNARVLIAGTAPTRRVRRLAGDGVAVSGWVDDMASCYSRTRLFVAPLPVGTGQPNKLLQAFAAGVPSITTEPARIAVGAGPDEVLSGTTSADIARHVSDLLASPDRATEIGLRGRAFAQSRLRWSDAVAALERVVCAEPVVS